MAFVAAEPGFWAHIIAPLSGEVPAVAIAGEGADPAPDSGPGAGRLVAGRKLTITLLAVCNNVFTVHRDASVGKESALV